MDGGSTPRYGLIMTDTEFGYVILLRERDGRVVTLVEDDPNHPGRKRTCIFPSKIKAVFEGSKAMEKFDIIEWNIVEAP